MTDKLIWYLEQHIAPTGWQMSGGVAPGRRTMRAGGDRSHRLRGAPGFTHGKTQPQREEAPCPKLHDTGTQGCRIG